MFQVDKTNDLVAEGLARYKARDLVGAIDFYRQALASDPQCLEARERLGYALEERQDILSEIGSARERLADCPDDVQARFRLAQRLETLVRREEAMAEFASVGRIDASGRWGKSAQKMLRKRSLPMTA